MSGCGCKGFGAFGLDVPTSSGTVVADPGALHFCSPTGDPRALQQMLTDLGFYHGPIATDVGIASMIELAVSGAEYMKTKGMIKTTSQADACAAIIADWTAKKAASRSWLLGGVATAAAVVGYLWWRK